MAITNHTQEDFEEEHQQDSEINESRHPVSEESQESDSKCKLHDQGCGGESYYLG